MFDFCLFFVCSLFDRAKPSFCPETFACTDEGCKYSRAERLATFLEFCLFDATKILQFKTKDESGSAGTVGVRRPMDIIVGWALVVLIIGGVVVYGVTAETASGRSAEPRRRRPF